MSVVVIPMGPMYVKKVDAKDYLLKTHRGTAFVATIYACFIIGMKSFLSYSLQTRGIDIYNEFTQIGTLLYEVLALLIASKLYLGNPDYDSMNKRINGYKAQQMIKTELIVGDYYKKVVSVLFLGFVIALVSIIWPIYSAISNMT
jgi:hypothetical protein